MPSTTIRFAYKESHAVFLVFHRWKRRFVLGRIYPADVFSLSAMLSTDMEVMA